MNEVALAQVVDAATELEAEANPFLIVLDDASERDTELINIELERRGLRSRVYQTRSSAADR